MTVSDQRVRNSLHEAGLRSQHPVGGPVPTAQHSRARVVFAIDHHDGKCTSGDLCSSLVRRASTSEALVEDSLGSWLGPPLRYCGVASQCQQVAPQACAGPDLGEDPPTHIVRHAHEHMTTTKTTQCHVLVSCGLSM